MKATIHVEGKNAAELAQGLRAHLAIYEGATAAQKGTTVAGTKLTGKKAAAATVDEDEEEYDLADESEDEETEESEDADESEDEETEDAEEETEEAAVTLQDITAASVKCAKRNSREAVGKIFKKFGAKALKDIKKTDYAKVLAALKK